MFEAVFIFDVIFIFEVVFIFEFVLISGSYLNLRSVSYLELLYI